MSEKSPFHRHGERMVKGLIRKGTEGEYIGREENPRVAEAMGHAAKPLIDEALRGMEAPPNSLAILELPNGKKGLSAIPGTVTEEGYRQSYGDMADKVKRGYEEADRVQKNYYEPIREATRRAEDTLKQDPDDV